MRATVIAFTLLAVVSEVTCSIKVTGFVGGGLLIKCKFDKRYQSRKKHFCKDEENRCSRLNQAVNKRYKEFNIRADGLYVVFIKQLAVGDSGEYRCAVNKEDKKDDRKLEISIKQDNCCNQPLAVASHVGGHVDISCKYPSESSDSSKYFCRQTNPFNCSNLIPDKPPASRKRFSVTENKSQNTFTVRISNVRSKDSGVYWCGVSSGDRMGSVALLTEVSVTVQDSTLVTRVCLTLVVLMLGVGVFVCLRCKHNRTSKPVPSSDHLAIRTSSDDPQDPPADLCDASDPTDGPSYAMVRFHRNPEQQSRGSTTGSLQTEGAVVHTGDTACEYATVKNWY